MKADDPLPERRLRYVNPLPKNVVKECMASGFIESVFGVKNLGEDANLYIEECYFEYPRKIRAVFQIGKGRIERTILLTHTQAFCDEVPLDSQQRRLLLGMLEHYCQKGEGNHTWLTGSEIPKDAVRSRSERADYVVLPPHSDARKILENAGVVQHLQRRFFPEASPEHMKISVPVKYLVQPAMTMFLALEVHGESFVTDVCFDGLVRDGTRLSPEQVAAVQQVVEAIMPPTIPAKPYNLKFASKTEEEEPAGGN